MQPYIKAFAIKNHEGKILISEYLDRENIQEIEDYLKSIPLDKKDRLEYNNNQFFLQPSDPTKKKDSSYFGVLCVGNSFTDQVARTVLADILSVLPPEKQIMKELQKTKVEVFRRLMEWNDANETEWEQMSERNKKLQYSSMICAGISIVIAITILGFLIMIS